MDWKTYLGVPSAAAACIGVYVTLGGPVPAWSTDIRKLTVKQTEITRDFAGMKLRSLISQQPPSDPTARRVWEEEIDQARGERKQAQDRLIELSK